MLFREAEKCFNKIWLKYCIIDIQDVGIPEKYAMLVYHLNKGALVNIATPLGKTDNIHLKGKAKQETIYGPKLFCAATGNDNVIDETSFHMMNKLEIENRIYLDDIN